MLWSAEMVDVERAECLRLLSSECVGRVVFTEAALPAALPVNYVVDGEEVVFRTRRGGQLATAVPGRVVGFEIDSIDLDTRTGWSVLGVGEAYEVNDPARRARLAHRWPEPWAPDRTDIVVSIPVQLLSGRRICRGGRASPRHEVVSSGAGSCSAPPPT